MTQYERIKAMTIEEMSHCNDICPLDLGIIRKHCDKAHCHKCRMEFLTSEVKENDR